MSQHTPKPQIPASDGPRKVNKLTAPLGTVVALTWPEVTAWLLCGWEYKGRAGVNSVQLVKVR